MKNKSTFQILSILVVLLSIVFASCSKSDDDTSSSSSTPVKALNKSTLIPKKWYSQGSVFVHDLQSGGMYGNKGGSWKWKNNSDTLEIISQAGYAETYWKVYWNTSTEMECEKVGTFTKLLYKDVAW